MSDRTLRALSAALALVGLGVAAYLTVIHYADIDPVCGISHGCHKVQTSEWSKLVGIPVAVLGLVGYVGILAAVLVPGEAARLAAAAMALAGFGFSAYLTYRELFTIDAICQWCVVSAVLMTGLAVTTTWRMLAAGPPVPREGSASTT